MILHYFIIAAAANSSNQSTPLPPGRRRLPSTRILQQTPVNLTCWEMHISDHRPSDENVLDAAEVGVLQLVEDGDVVEFDVEVLVDGFEGAADGDVVFQLDG